MEDPSNSLPEQISSLTEVLLMMSHLNMGALTAVGTSFETNCQNAGGSAADCNDDTWSDGPTSGTATDMVLINGMHQPAISLVANRWYRWRMVFAAVDAVLEPMLTGCEIKLLAKVGLPYPKPTAHLVSYP